MKKTILLLFFIIFLYGKNSDTKNIDTMCENGEISLCSAAGFSYANSGNIDKAIALYSNGCKSVSVVIFWEDYILKEIK